MGALLRVQVFPRADHLELRRQDVHGFTARPFESDDPEAAAAEFPLMADLRRPLVEAGRPKPASQSVVLNVNKVASYPSAGGSALGHQPTFALAG
jgi:hypothetical protein